jgi:transposase
MLLNMISKKKIKVNDIYSKSCVDDLKNTLIVDDKCIWFNKKEKLISNKIPYHEISNINNDKKFFNNIIHNSSDYYINDNFKIKKQKLIDYDKINEKLIKSKNDSLERNKDKKESTIKSIITKANKKIENYNKVIKTVKYEVQPDKKQKDIIFKWMKASVNVYNECVSANKNKDFNLDYTKSKLIIFKKLYGDEPKDAPYDMLTDEVRSFCSNIKSCISNLKNNNINHFELDNKNTSKGQSVLIPSKSINKNGFFTTKLGIMNGFDKIDVSKITSDSRLIYDRYFNKFYLKCPIYFKIKKIENRKSIVALDPGEKIFMAYYSLNDCGTIGDDIKKEILNYQVKIKKIQRGIKKNININKLAIKNKRQLKRKLQKYYKKIKDLVHELHNKTALFLVKNYNKILLPEFETQQMVKCFGRRFIKNKVKEIKNSELNFAEQKTEFRKYTKINKLAKSVKFVLNSLSHYSFKQHLINKAAEYGCEVKIVTEEYTSKCCSRCGILSNNYCNRVKTCKNCNLTIDRDINGSRNILIKNFE